MNDRPHNRAFAQPEGLTQTSPGSGRPTPATLGHTRKGSCALERRGRAFTLVEVLIIVAALALLILLLLPSVAGSSRSKHIACSNNLKQVSLAFRIWAGDHQDHQPMWVSVTNGGTMEWIVGGEVWPHLLVMSNELYTPKALVCPSDQSRIAATNWNRLRNANVSYFIALDADETQPQMFLSGDSNLEVNGQPVQPGLLNLWTNSTLGWTAARHNRQGNIALADGSVQQYSNHRFQQAFVGAGVATNRLAIP